MEDKIRILVYGKEVNVMLLYRRRHMRLIKEGASKTKRGAGYIKPCRF